MSSKARTLVKGSFAGTCNFLANAIVGFMLMPFIIHSLGDKEYGLWVIVGSLLGFYGLFSFGLVPAIQRYISRAIGRKDWQEANKVINTSLFLFSILGLIALLIIPIIMMVIPRFVKNPVEVNLFRQIVLILGLSTAMAFPMRVFSGVLISHIRYDLYTSIELIKLLVRAVLVVIFLKMGYGILALAFITAGVEISGYIIKLILVRIMYKYITLSRTFVDLKLLRPLFKYSSVSFVIEIAVQLSSRIGNFVIAGFMGLSFVTVYAVASNLIRYFSKSISSSVGLMLPVFSQYEGKNDYYSIREKYILSVKISGYLSVFIGGALIVFGRVFIERWMGKEYLSAYPLLVVLAIPTILSLMQKPSRELLYGVSKHKFYAIVNSILGITTLIFSLILVKKFGLMGVALGFAIPLIIVKLFIEPIYVCKVINFEIRKYYFKIIMPIILKSFLIFLAFWQIFKSFIVPNYLNLVILISCESLLFSIVIFFIGFNNTEKNYFKKAIMG